MKKMIAASDPDAYVASLSGWQQAYVSALRATVLASAQFEERIKWGHLVYFSNGPVLLIRAEEARVLFGFWRGKRLLEIEPRLKPGGKYELATLVLLPETSLEQETVIRLVQEAHALNHRIGNPTTLVDG